jgi:hypothetical protein
MKIMMKDQFKERDAKTMALKAAIKTYHTNLESVF